MDFDISDTLEEIGHGHFVDGALQGLVYTDVELPLASDHKMLEPEVVARLAQGLKLKKDGTALEIGTGSGCATALLPELAGKVITGDIGTE